MPTKLANLKSDPPIILEVVIHTQYGGFHIDTEMALWLMENKGWKIGRHEDPSVDLVECDIADYYYPQNPIKTNDIGFRSHPDLVECVKTLQQLHKNDDWTERKRTYVNNLSVVDIFAKIEIYHVFDGIETVRMQCFT